VRSTTEVEALIERTKKKIAALQKDEKAAQKSKSAFAPLTRCDMQLRIVDAERDRLSLAHEKIASRIEEIDRELVDLAESEGLAVGELPAAGSKQAQLEAEEAMLREKLESPRWRRDTEALQGRRRQFESDRELEASEQAEAIEEELKVESEKLAADTAKSVEEHVRPLQERWRQITAGWMAYEKARGVNAVGRLDVSEFPIQVGEITAPIPMVLQPDHDPAVRPPVPTA
jgi:chromosome segregation ATPase